MKNFKIALIIAAISFSPSWMVAKQITQETAQKVAENQVLSRSQLRSGQSPMLNLVHVETTATENNAVGGAAKVSSNSNTPADVLYYVYNVGDNGFVIVSGDDIAVPVLGYSDSGTYDPNNLAPNFVYWMDCLANEIKEAIANNISQSEKTKTQWEAYLSGNAVSLRAATAAVSPLLGVYNGINSIAWNQGTPYNNDCPVDPTTTNTRSVTGCAATAMAQIMRYYSYPTTGNATISGYQTTTRGIIINDTPVNFPDLDWGNMLPNYSMTPSNSTQQAAVAYLMYICGISAEMDYTAAGSGAPTVNVGSALLNYFKYDKSLTYKQRAYYSNKDWEALLKSEIDNNRPVFYAGFYDYNTSAPGGHAFVCDGYDDNYKGDNITYFHFNWGWGGYCNDTYFLTSSLNPGNEGIGSGKGTYNEGQEILVNFQPDKGGAQGYEICFDPDDAYPFTPSKTQVNIGENFSMDGYWYMNNGFYSITCTIGVGLYDQNGQFLTIIGKKFNTSNIDAGWSTASTFTCQVPTSVSPGNYLIKPIALDNANNIIPVHLPVGFTAPTLTVKGIVLDHSTLNMVVGSHAQLTPTYYLSSAPTNVKWISSDNTVASVDATTGLITAIKAGNTNIMITFTDTSSGTPYTYSASCAVTVSDPIIWLGKNYTWKDPTNWSNGKIPTSTDIVTIPGPDKVTIFPDLTIYTDWIQVAEIHFMPGAQLGGQSRLQPGVVKAFVQYDFTDTHRNRWLMMSMPLGQAYPADFAFGGYPAVWVRTFTSTPNGTVANSNWSTSQKSTLPFTYGDGFVIWLNADATTDNPNKGLKLLNGIRELPFYQHHAPGSVDLTFYQMVNQNHDFDGNTTSTFYNYKNDPSGLVRNKDQVYTVQRNNLQAYQLAGLSVSKTLDFADGSFAMTGNPYMAALDFGALYNANKQIIKPTYYVWTGVGYESYTYSSGVVTTAAGIVADNPMTQYIAPLQGFIVEKSVGPPLDMPMLQYNAMTMTSVNHNNVSWRSSKGNDNILSIVAGNSVAKYRTLISKQEGGQDEFGNLDARAISNGISDVPEIYTLKPYKSGLVATIVNFINNDDILIPVGLATSYSGNITLSFSGMAGYDANLTLIDAVANKEINLTGLTSYDYAFNYTPKTVNGTAVACENRFFIRISKTVTGLSNTLAEKVNVYESNGRIQVVSGASNPIKEVNVYNLQGALFYKVNAGNAISCTVDRNLPVGAYIVKVVSEKNIDIVKLIIR